MSRLKAIKKYTINNVDMDIRYSTGGRDEWEKYVDKGLKKAGPYSPLWGGRHNHLVSSERVDCIVGACANYSGYPLQKKKSGNAYGKALTKATEHGLFNDDGTTPKIFFDVQHKRREVVRRFLDKEYGLQPAFFSEDIENEDFNSQFVDSLRTGPKLVAQYPNSIMQVANDDSIHYLATKDGMVFDNMDDSEGLYFPAHFPYALSIYTKGGR